MHERYKYKQSNVLFIDSTCLLCDGFARRIIANLKPESNLRIASLNGEIFAELMTRVRPIDEDAMVYWKNGEANIGHAAVIALRSEVRIMYRTILSLIRLVPTSTRALVYRWVSRNRKIWFGSQDACSLQNPLNQDSWRYLDD